jgi:hypothetical protein
MSDLQDLIHKTSMDCLERGKQIERERVVRLLESQLCIFEINVGNCKCVVCQMTTAHLELIKGKTK